MEQMTPASILAIFDSNKEQRTSFVAQIIEAIESGNTNPLSLHVSIKNMEEILKSITGNDRYKSILLEEAQKHSGRSFGYYNAQIQIKEVSTEYDWSACEDPVLNELMEEMEYFKKKIKDRQTFLKNIPAAGIEVLKEDELITIYPPAKKSTTGVAVSLK